MNDTTKQGMPEEFSGSPHGYFSHTGGKVGLRSASGFFYEANQRIRTLRSLLAEARGERDEAKQAATDINNTLFDVLAREQDAEQSLAEQRKDAERYRWLRENEDTVCNELGYLLQRDALDTAIDAAIPATRESSGISHKTSGEASVVSPSAEPCERKGD